MKKLAKVILAFVLIFAIGTTGFILGKNTGFGSMDISEDDKIHLSQMDQMKELIKKNYLFDYDEKALYQGSLKGMFENLGDPYTVYYTKDEYDKLMESVNGEYAGIGVTVQAIPDGYIKAISVFKNTPAEKAGIKAGDYIIKVDGEAFMSNQMELAVSKIKGKPGTKVKLTILREDKEKKKNNEIEMEVERANVKVETVDGKAIDVDDKKIGYLQLKQFEDVSWDDFTSKIKELEDEQVDGIVLDLRNNPGGNLDVCLNISDYFLDKGTIVSTVDKNGKKEVEESDDEKDTIPLVVIINENSASASEILSGALKDRNRAKIIGKTSFGKGVVQRLFPFEDGSGAKITVSEYFTPNDTKINQIGVKPDIEVNSSLDGLDINKDNLDKDDQYKKAVEELLKEIK